MTKFESNIKLVNASQEAVYERLSNFSNLKEAVKFLPADKAGMISVDAENISVAVPQVGNIILKIVEKDPGKCIKFGTVTSPLPFNLWIQLLPESETACKMKVTIGLEINPFMKTMVQKPLKESVEKMADMLAAIRY